ncbi:MAG: YihY/virulence factor BrkB family protein [Aphanocapsa lilacina HA4352-LM1]|jgi:membrane protein|nr:YihY/virulence factor BrkB family protein [Aphanocapsa lilacina HA4352-LM1]
MTNPQPAPLPLWQKGLDLLKETGQEWSNDKVPRLAAALAYYTFFSLAPLLVVVIAVAGFFLGPDAVRGQLDNQIAGLVGQQSASAIQELVKSAYHPASGFTATAIALGAILFGVSGLFGELQDALNTIWGVAPKPDRSWVEVVKQRFVSFSMVFGIAFLMLVSLVVSAVVSAVTGYFGALLPMPGFVPGLVDVLVSVAITTLLFAMIYKVLPDVKIAWQDVAIGAAMTAILFVLGKSLIGLYLGQSSFGSSYGAAGSLVVVLVWVYYTVQILFFGAEFTKVFAKKYGSQIVPSDNAMPIEQSVLARQGIGPSQYSQAVEAPAEPAALPALQAVGAEARLDPDARDSAGQPGPTNPLKRAAAFILSFLVLARLRK